MRQVAGSFVYYKPHEILARVIRVYPVDSTDAADQLGPAYCDLATIDGMTFLYKIPIAYPFGIIRMPREGQIVTVSYMQGLSQNPIVEMHLYNTSTNTLTSDPVFGNKNVIVNPDDFVIYHDETSSYLRFRNSQSTSSAPAGDGGPADVTLQFASGAQLRFTEYLQDSGYPASGASMPPPPTMCKVSIASASSLGTGTALTITMDDQAGTIVLRTGTGHTITMADKADSPIGVTIQTASGELSHILDDSLNKITTSVNGATTGITHILDGQANKLTHAVGSELSHILNGETQQITHQAAQVFTLFDGVGNAISHVVPGGGLLGLGAIASSLPATQAVAAQAHLEELTTNIIQTTMQTMSAAVGLAAVTAGIPNSSGFHAILSAAGFIKGLPGIFPTIPGCSAITRTA